MKAFYKHEIMMYNIIYKNGSNQIEIFNDIKEFGKWWRESVHLAIKKPGSVKAVLPINDYTVKIVPGKLGYYLRVNGFWISAGFDDYYTPLAIHSKYQASAPYGATQWVSVKAIRRFWNEKMPFVVSSTLRPYISHWGNLIQYTLK